MIDEKTKQQIEAEERVRAEARAKAEKEIKKRNDSDKAKKVAAGFLVLFIIAILVWLFVLRPAMGTDREFRERRDAFLAGEAEDYNYLTKTDTPERDIELAILNIREFTKRDGVELESKLKDITLEPHILKIAYMASDSLTVGLTRSGIWINTKDLLEELPQYLPHGVDEIEFRPHLVLVDQYGEESVREVMIIRVQRETWERISWDRFLYDNIPDIADYYWQHHALD